MTLSSTVIREVTSLENMGLDELREVWRSHWGPPPPLRSPGLLRLTIAWRLQARELGGLDRNIRRALASQSASPADGLNLGEGAVIRRQWQGQLIEVVVRSEGFEWKGEIWKSLSAIARNATGVRRNGPAFFGLRGDGK
ncbi:MAG: DUF2924 domain-containing protein [Marinosulfonomonas sp.]|nr:DUF2924 domain-containing protein [Marinosulfonomonas sp.]